MSIPPFCPNQRCLLHYENPTGTWYHRNGSHSTDTFGRVQRYKCLACGKTFSDQTFSVEYWVKRIIPLEDMERLLASSMSVRALSRHFHCSCDSVINRSDRLARQAISLHATLRPQADKREAVCIDGLVNFDHSQYYPNDIAISITSEARFILAMSHAVTRRGGRLRPIQKVRKKELYKNNTFEKSAVERAFREQLDLLRYERSPEKYKPLVLITDEKKEYRRAILKHMLFLEQDEDHRFAHLTVNSRLPRTYWNPLFPSNYIDKEIRKDQANFRRETGCISRNASNCLSRLYSYVVYHNYVKRYLIAWPGDMNATHAEVAGIEAEKITQAREQFFKLRAFVSRLALKVIDWKIWVKAVYNPRKQKIAYSYIPKFAFD